MRLTHCTFAPYRLPLRQPWAGARGGFAVREGWLVRLVTDSGLIGYGDCAPLPQAGTENMDSAVACLSGWAAVLPGLSLEPPHLRRGGSRRAPDTPQAGERAPPRGTES